LSNSLDNIVSTAKRQAVVTRPPQTDFELWVWVWTVFGVKLPRFSVCDGHTAPFTAFADAYFARNNIQLWKGSRGLAGKSYTLAVLGMTEAVTLGAEVNVLGGSASQSLNVHGHMGSLWYHPNAPRNLLIKDPTKYETLLRNGAKIKALMASSRSVRGPHPQRLRLDEIDEMELDILDSAMGMPMPTRTIKSNTVMSSTHQYADGTMTEMMKRAKERGYPIYSWCHVDTSNPIDGWLTQDMIETKKLDVSKEMWRVEYELGEPAIEGRAFTTTAVEAMFDKSNGMYEGKPSEELIFQKPVNGVMYATGVDWGRKRDWTVIDTFRMDTWERVAWMRVNKEDWPKMVQRVVRRLRMYPGHLAHDATGLGDVVASLFPEDFRMKGQIEDVIMNGAARSTLFAELIAAVEDGSLSSPYIDWARDEMVYCTHDDLFRAGVTFHPPDSVVAAAMAWSLRGKQRLNIAPLVDQLTKGASGWAIPNDEDEHDGPSIAPWVS
jgi:hypothetical protein